MHTPQKRVTTILPLVSHAHMSLLGRDGCSRFENTLQPTYAHTGEKPLQIPEGSLPGAPSSHPSNENCGPSAHDKIHHVGLAAPGSLRPGWILLVLVLSPHCIFFFSSTSLQTTSFLLYPNSLEPPWLVNLAETGFKKTVVMLERW